MDLRILPIYPAPTDAILRALKSVKQQMAVDYLIKPQKAAQGVSGRILAVGERPNWLAFDGYAWLPNVDNEVSVEAALEWCMGKEDARATDLTRQLKDIFGDGVKEIDYRQLSFEGLSSKLRLDAGSTPTFR